MTPIETLHQRVDTRAGELERRHAERLVCQRGCAACCVDDITVFQIEADLISTRATEVLDQPPAPIGRCAFLDEAGACRIYRWRPYVCRTQGLPLRWLEEDDEALVEYRDICPLNEDGTPIEDLSEDDCWTIGETEGALARLQQETYSSRARVSLRSLFASDRDAAGTA